MTLISMNEIEAPYLYVVSEEAVAEVRRLLQAVPIMEASIVVPPTEEEPMRSILELEGLGMEIWEGVDPRTYVNDLRDEWNDR